MVSHPQYSGQPVIMIHLVAREGSNIAYCADVPYTPPNDDTYRDIPRVPCPACFRPRQGEGEAGR